MSNPLISFCIPVHNAENYLEETILAVLDQDYSNTEVICVNDHSNDNSIRILKKFSSRITVLNAIKFGASAARNLAFENSNGDFIVFFDADDLILPNYASSQLSKVKDKNSVVICTWGRFIQTRETFREDVNILKRNMTLHDWVMSYWTCNLHTTPPGRTLIPRELLAKADLWDETLSLNDDLDFFTRVFAAATEIIYNDDTCFLYRSGINGLSSKTKGYKYQVSNCKSFDKATRKVSSIYGNDALIKRACANMWQQFVYENYPNNKDLVNYAKEQIKFYGGADFKFPAGGTSQFLSNLFGWKTTKRLQVISGDFRKLLNK